MYKLLNANFSRLKKNKVFWGITIITIILAFSFLLNSIKNESKHNIDNLLFDYINIIGLFIAMFTSLFVGTEYAYGTIRNKIIVGHSRINIYLSNFIVSVAVGFFIEFVYMIIVAVIGIPIIGELEMNFYEFTIFLLETLMVIIAYSSIFNAITLLCSDITISTTTCMLLFLIMFIIASGLTTIINTPKYITTIFYDEQGVPNITSSELNPDYPNKLTIDICNFIFYALPTGQTIEISEQINKIKKDNLQIYENSEKLSVTTIFLYLFGIIFIVNSIGLYLFNRKELK